MLIEKIHCALTKMFSFSGIFELFLKINIPEVRVKTCNSDYNIVKSRKTAFSLIVIFLSNLSVRTSNTEISLDSIRYSLW